MSLDHKAFILDYDGFNTELKPLLETCLESGDFEEIRKFVSINRSSCTDPYEGEKLDNNWENMIEEKDVHQYGDFALTRYYSPTEDKGLSDEWELINKICLKVKGLKFSPVLGIPLGPNDNLFDPGKMGSYFQSFDNILESLSVLNNVRKEIHHSVTDSYDCYIELLQAAIDQKKGLYVTF